MREPSELVEQVESAVQMEELAERPVDPVVVEAITVEEVNSIFFAGWSFFVRCGVKLNLFVYLMCICKGSSPCSAGGGSSFAVTTA